MFGLTIINKHVNSRIAPPNQFNPLQKAKVVLKTYTGEKIDSTGFGLLSSAINADGQRCRTGRLDLPTQSECGIKCNLLNSETNQEDLLDYCWVY